MTTDDLIGKIAEAAARGDWRQVQLHSNEIKRLVLDDGRSLSGIGAYRLVEALSNGVASGPGASGAYDIAKLIAEVSAAVKKVPVDRTALQTSWEPLYQLLGDPLVETKLDDLVALLKSLKNARTFDLLAKTADRVLVRHSDNPSSATVRTLYAQALLDSGQMYAGIAMLEGIVDRPELPQMDRDEACGLIGRAHKQIYVDHVKSGIAASMRGRFQHFLQRSLDSYGKLYNPDLPAERYWHGINIAALLALAQLDGMGGIVDPTKIGAKEIARRLIEALTPKMGGSDQWLAATLGEAHVLLGDYASAAKYYGIFARSADAFALGSALRQLEEVHRVHAGHGGAGPILAILKAAQIGEPDGKFTLDGDSLKALSDFAKTSEYRQFSETMVPGGQFVKLADLQIVVHRAAAVASLCDLTGRTQGTGFLVKGTSLLSRLGDNIYLVTNAHVLSDPDKPGREHRAPLTPSTMRVVLEGAGGVALPCDGHVLWQSPLNMYDVAIIKVAGSIGTVAPLAFASEDSQLKAAEQESNDGSRVSVIGYPLGGPLSLSIVGTLQGANGMLVDKGGRNVKKDNEKDDGPVYLHYRAPTEPGNSGSPVFETTRWEVVGLHHEGFDPFEGRPRLNGRSGKVMANEGIFIHSIRRELAKVLR